MMKMYYKVMKGGQCVDVLDRISFVKYQEKHGLLLLCTPEEAQAILSSSGEYGWHIEGLYNFIPDNEKYELLEISKYEYDQRKKYQCKTKEELIDAVTLELLERGIL